MTTQYKGADDKTEIDLEDFEVGDAFTAEIGDWNGTRWSYHQNGNAKVDFLVVETTENDMVVVSYDDRLEWTDTGSDEFEVSIHDDGNIENFGNLAWNYHVKDIERHAGRGGEHMVVHGRQKSGRVRWD